MRAHLAQAQTAELARDHAAARRHYDAAIAAAVAARRPDWVRLARRELIDTLLSWGELGAAASQLEALVAQAPRDAAAWHDLGIVWHNLGNDASALMALARARDLTPSDPRPRIALAALYWQRGERALALRQYRELLRLELPAKVRDKVRWAIDRLEAPAPSTQSAGAPP